MDIKSCKLYLIFLHSKKNDKKISYEFRDERDYKFETLRTSEINCAEFKSWRSFDM